MSTTKVRTCCAFLGIFIFVLVATATPADPPSAFWGCWVVTKMLPTPGISGLSQKQVNAIIGTRLVFTPACARSGHTVARSPEYSTKILSDRDFFKLGYVSLKQIGVTEQEVTQVSLVKPELSDLDFLGDYVFLRSKDIVIEVEGDFFVAEKAKPGNAACTCEAPEARACNDKAKTQGEMNACASEEAARVDAQLNDVYRKLLSQAASQQEAVAKIKAAEKAWIAYRDAYVDAMYPAKDKQAEYGSIYPMEADLLRAKLTERQVTALKELLQQYSGESIQGPARP